MSKYIGMPLEPHLQPPEGNEEVTEAIARVEEIEREVDRLTDEKDELVDWLRDRGYAV